MDEQNDEEGLIIIPSKKVLKKCKTSPVLQKWGGFCSGVSWYPLRVIGENCRAWFKLKKFFLPEIFFCFLSRPVFRRL